MRKRIASYFVLMLVMLATAQTAVAAFKDVKVDLTNGNLLEESELVQWGAVGPMGIAVADDGSITRVDAADETSVCTISGKWHSNQYGWSGLVVTIPVEGPVKITYGLGDFSGDVSVKDGEGNEVATMNIQGSTWSASHPENVTSTYYKGGATTLTISGGSYQSYFAVEAADPSELVEDITVTYDITGIEGIEGTAPENVTVEQGGTFDIPLNKTLYVEGKTLTGWTDGTDNYSCGSSVTAPSENLILTPVFVANAVSLDDRTAAVTLKWDFQRKNGAPVMAYQGSGATGIYVTQANVNGSVIDVKLDFDATSGKIANANWTDWCQINGGTKFVIPSCKGATVSVEAYNALTELTIDGQNDYTSGKTISYTVASSNPTVEIVMGSEGSYYRYIQTVMPVVANHEGATYNETPGTITWHVGNEESGIVADDIADAISSTSVSVGGGLTATEASYFDTNMIKYQPATSNAGNVEAVMIEYRVKPAKGVKFQPTGFSFDAVKVGTDGATFSWSYTIDGVESSITEMNAETVLRNNGANAETAQLNHQMNINAGEGDEFTLRFYISKTANTKQICIGNVVISGKVSGTVEEVETYPLTIAASPAEGGSVSAYPKEDAYEADTEVTLTATENFGYDFVNWTDSEGNVVSTAAKFVYTVAGGAALTANFVAVNTYELKLAVDGVPSDYMVDVNPAPTMVDGKRMYEQDTYVILTAKQYEGLVNFNYWSDGQTTQSIQVKMNQDVDLTAYFSQNDIIAGWDFYTEGNRGRKADFFSEDNETTGFNLVSDDGQESSWLDKSTEKAGGYESFAGAAVNWTTGSTEGDVGHCYWQTKINAGAFTDVKLQFQMLYNYNSYTKYDVEYSTDGEEWTKFGSITLEGAKSVATFNGSLGEGADNEASLYVRWHPDLTSAVAGTSSKNDGNAIAMVFFTGTPGIVDDGKAPVLVNTVPADGTQGVSANGRIVLTFDEKVQMAEGTAATIGGKQLEAVVSGRTATFEYKSLDYSTEYTFTLPANSITDLAGNAYAEDINIQFTTMERSPIEKKLYDFVVPWDGTIAEAIQAANSRTNTTERFRIFVLDGTYTLPLSTTETINSDDGNTYPSPITNVTAPNISFIGQSMDGAVITNSAGGPTFAGTYGPTSVYDGIGKSDVLQLQKTATETYFQDITVKSGINDALGRNLAVQDKASKTIYKNTCLWGYQDTWTSNNNNGLFYFENGKVRGRTDFLCGKGDAYFNNVEIQVCMNTGGYIAVPSQSLKYGFVFKDCTIKGESSNLNGKYTLGRPWGNGTPVALWIDTKMEIIPSTIGWSEMSKGWPKRFAEYNSMTANGGIVDLSGRKTTFGDGHANNPILTAEEAAEASDMTNMYGEWNPTIATEQASAPANVVLRGNELTWDNSNYVLLWAVLKDGNIVKFTTENSFTVDDPEATYSLRAANQMGGLGEETVATVKEGFLMGDVNHDGEVSVADVNLLVRVILGQSVEVFFEEEADMNGDGNVSVADVMSIVEIILAN